MAYRLLTTLPPCRRLPALASLVTLTLLLSACGPQSVAPSTARVTIGGQTFHLELALTEAARYQGLSDRRHIPAHGGMLFVFSYPQPLIFVMRRCYVPIDLIFVDRSDHIVRMFNMKVQPYDTPEADLTQYSSGAPCQFAIELAAGTIQRLGLHEGDKVSLDTSLIRYAQ